MSTNQIACRSYMRGDVVDYWCWGIVKGSRELVNNSNIKDNWPC